MRYTPFAGLTLLDPSDPITLDGASFQERNPAITDHLLRIGAFSHRHDAHAALPSPTGPLSASLLGDQGALSAETDYALTYTLSDADGGETRPAPIVTLTTGTQLAAPDGELSALVDYSAGIMPAGTYFYAKTLVDGAGGETPIGPTTLAYVDPGYASAQVQLTGLAGDVPAGGAWRLWRSQEGEDWRLVTQSTAEDYLDSGFDPPDNPAVPPEDNETGQTWAIRVILPAADAASAINVYLGTDGNFTSPSLYGSYPAASAGVAITLDSDVTLPGSPPPVSTAIGGAAKIDPDSDMLDFPWKRPVANVGALPSEGNEDGDVREVLSVRALYSWDEGEAAWQAIGSGGGGGGGSSAVWLDPVATSADLPGGAANGSFALALDTFDLWAYSLGEWVDYAAALRNQGAGTHWHAGSGVPSIDGIEGDWFIDLDTGDLYDYAGTGWVLQGNLRGPQVTAIAATQQGASYTFALADAGTVVEATASGAVNLTIPPHSDVALAEGTVIEVFQYGAGPVTIVAGAGVTLRSDAAKTRTAGQYATIGLRQRAIDEWVLSGDLA